MNQKIYNILTQLGRLILPGIATIYFVLALMFDLPGEWAVLGVLSMGIIICGVMLELKDRHKDDHDGHIVITEDAEGKKTFSLELMKNPDELTLMDVIVFKVTNESDKDIE